VSKTETFTHVDSLFDARHVRDRTNLAVLEPVHCVYLLCLCWSVAWYFSGLEQQDKDLSEYIQTKNVLFYIWLKYAEKITELLALTHHNYDLIFW